MITMIIINNDKYKDNNNVDNNSNENDNNNNDNSNDNHNNIYKSNKNYLWKLEETTKKEEKKNKNKNIFSLSSSSIYTHIPYNGFYYIFQHTAITSFT